MMFSLFKKHKKKLPTLFISHGGGPWSLMSGDYRKKHEVLEKFLKTFPRTLYRKPSAILVVTAHWEAEKFLVSSNPKPPMIYDYSGFPEHTYKFEYKAPGGPAIANEIYQLFTEAGIDASLDSTRGLDHGTFVPLSVMYPDGDIPIIQLSVRADFDPAAHIAAGRALAPLRDAGVLIVGSGLSYHNPLLYGEIARESSAIFDDWLQTTITRSTPPKRVENLIRWSDAPLARTAHPREEHLLPLFVVIGAAEFESGQCCYQERGVSGFLTVSNFVIGSPNASQYPIQGKPKSIFDTTLNDCWPFMPMP